MTDVTKLKALFAGTQITLTTLLLVLLGKAHFVSVIIINSLMFYRDIFAVLPKPTQNTLMHCWAERRIF